MKVNDERRNYKLERQELASGRFPTRRYYPPGKPKTGDKAMNTHQIIGRAERETRNTLPADGSVLTQIWERRTWAMPWRERDAKTLRRVEALGVTNITAIIDAVTYLAGLRAERRLRAERPRVTRPVVRYEFGGTLYETRSRAAYQQRKLSKATELATYQGMCSGSYTYSVHKVIVRIPA